MTTPWWDSFFSGMILDSQRGISAMMPTAAEADFLVQTFDLPPGSSILDVPCGTGRLTLELAARGYQLTGFDLTEAYLEDGRQAAAARGLTISFHQGDMAQLPWKSTFDGIFCFGNSFAYFDDERNLQFLRSVGQSLKSRGTFVLETNLAAESVFSQAIRGRWYRFNDIYFLHDTQYDPPSGRLTSTYTLLRGAERETKQAIYRIYTVRELLGLFRQADLDVVATYGSLKREPFTLGAPGLYVVARRA